MHATHHPEQTVLTEMWTCRRLVNCTEVGCAAAGGFGEPGSIEPHYGCLSCSGATWAPDWPSLQVDELTTNSSTLNDSKTRCSDGTEAYGA